MAKKNAETPQSFTSREALLSEVGMPPEKYYVYEVASSGGGSPRYVISKTPAAASQACTTVRRVSDRELAECAAKAMKPKQDKKETEAASK